MTSILPHYVVFDPFSPHQSNIEYMAPEPTRSATIEKCLATQSRLVKKIDISALDMRDYSTALTPNGHESTVSAESKRAIQGLWDEHFQPVQTPLPDIDCLAEQSPLNIVIIGAGIAGSAAYSRLAQLKVAEPTKQGHTITLLEKRDHPPSRENMVTIDKNARGILETIPTCAKRLFQTQGDIGCSERAPLKDIESSLLEAGNDSNQVVVRGCSEIDVSYDPKTMTGSVSYTLKGEKYTIKSADLIIVASGARSGNPFEGDETSIVKQHFKITPKNHDYGAVAYFKYRYPVNSEQEVPLPGEKDILLTDETGKTLTNKWINLYQGRKTYAMPNGEVNGYENSLIMEIPVKLCKQGEQAQTSYLTNLFQSLQTHSEPEMRKVAQSYLGHQEAVNTTTLGEEKVVGTAMVSHWYADSSKSDDNGMVGIGDAMCPPHPWTGSGSNLAIQATTPVLKLADRLSRIKASHLPPRMAASYRNLAFTHFDEDVTPLISQAILRGSFSSQLFNKVQEESFVR